MSFSNDSTDTEFAADQTPFANENLTPFVALQRARMKELERLQKMNSEKKNEENGKKMTTANPLPDRMKLLLSTAKFADAHFLVGKYDEKELVPAHRNILSASSEVFEAMFQKEATENANGTIASAEKDALLVPDVDAEAFKVMLRFIYSDDLSELNGKNAVELLYAALKFNVIGLVKAFADFPISQLSNVFTALSIARFNDLLKDFVQRCLAYIDKNSEDLIKSEEFLQIEQKLLCEIFEHDQLQISGEISIWNAALRWADEKCRENGIECSAENRRAMLGPALLKIRFPLFSQEEFSEKIVPSDVLSKDQVIAVYQFHALPNRRVISNGLFPMKFPTNGRISDRKEGTLLLVIENVYEFAREEIKSSRYSEKVYINKVPWKIWAQITTKIESTDNEKCLGIYLLCDAPKEDINWSCKCSATLRIVSQMIGVADFKKEFSEEITFNSESVDRGFHNFISFEELMDPEKGFYDKSEDKVALAIDVTVKEAKPKDKS
ncbi:hypothetical protein niasHS_012500 [Heterodera schachtii]|uniref:BTB domain-containing protein n=2 Tax=Heterodera TaxID=34509 RepID=A0ABD2IDP8_HETSC